jgi:hypothetical protein
MGAAAAMSINIQNDYLFPFAGCDESGCPDLKICKVLDGARKH